MKIIRRDKNITCKFKELNVGDVFIEIVDGDIEYIQIKMSEIESDKTYNAVSLTTGQPYEVDGDTIVCRVTAELAIK